VQAHKTIVPILFLILALTAHAHTNVSPYIRIRSQGTNAARSAQGWSSFIHRPDNDTFYFVCALTPSYSKSNKAGRMAENLFGRIVRGNKWDVASLSISGSGVEGRNPKDEFLADYFGLPRDFKGELFLKPRIDNFIAAFDGYFGFDNLIPGLWMRIQAPITYTRWDLNICEYIECLGSANHQPGYFNNSVVFGVEDPAGTYAQAFGVARDNLLKSFTDYVVCGATPILGKDVMFHHLKSARFLPAGDRKRRKGALADLHCTWGYDAWQTDWYYVSLGLAIVIPTGNRPEGTYAFEPIVGNGHHLEFGGLISSKITMWHDTHENQTLDLTINAHITHLFATHQRRTFDLKEKPNSRYMLAQKMTTSVNNLFVNTNAGNTAGSVEPLLQFDNVFMPVANISTVDVNVSVGWQTDAIIMLTYAKQNMNWDIGYNIWGHGCESIQLCSGAAHLIENNHWSLKGDAHVYGFSGTETAPSIDPIALSPSQSKATISHGTNNFTSTNTSLGGIDGIRPTRNPGVDDRAFARKTTGAAGIAQSINDRPDNLGQQTQTSKAPETILVDDLDLVGAQTKGLSHSFFAGFCYMWREYKPNYQPYISAGGQAEFHKVDCFCSNEDQHNCTLCFRPQDCSSCRFCGLSQWTIWIKGGISFD